MSDSRAGLIEFKLGWRILVIAMFGVGINVNASLLYAFGTLVLPLQQAFGWARADLQAAVSFVFFGAVIGTQVVGWLNHRYGMRRVTLFSLPCLAAMFLITTQLTSSIVSLYICFALLPLASMGCTQVTWTHLVNLWFERNRGLALAIVLSGTGVAAALMPSISSWAIGRWGWQATFIALAILPLVLWPLVWRWMREPPQREQTALQIARARSGFHFSEGLRRPAFWLLTLGLSLVVAGVVMLITATVPLLRDKGLSAEAAAGVFGGFGLALVAGRAVVGFLLDRLWPAGVAAVALALPAFGCVLLGIAGAGDTALLVVAVMLIGLGAGAEFDISAFLVSRYFGMRDYSRLYGVHLGFITLASALAPLLAGALYRQADSYTSTLAVCGGAFIAGSLLMLTLGRPQLPDVVLSQ